MAKGNKADLDEKTSELVASRLAEVMEQHFEEPETFELFTTLRYDPGLHQLNSHHVMLEEHLIPEYMFFLLDYHIEKLQRSSSYFEFNNTNLTKENILFGLTNCLSGKDRLVSYRIRIVLKKNGELSFTPVEVPIENILVMEVPKTNFDLHNFLYMPPLPSETGLKLGANKLPIVTNPISDPWIIHLAETPILPNQFTSFKTTHREIFNRFREEYNLPIPGKPHVTQSELKNTQDVLLYNHSNQVMETTIASIAVHRLITHPTNGTKQWCWVTPPLSTGCQDGSVRRWLLDEGEIIESMIELSSINHGEIILVFNAVSGVRLGQINKKLRVAV